MDFLENHARALYRVLNHGSDYSDCRALFSGGPLWEARVQEFTLKNGRPPDAKEEKSLKVLDRTILKGEQNFLDWCRSHHGKANCYVGRNPRNPDGTVSKVTTYSLDIDPEHPPRTSVSLELLDRAIVAGRFVLRERPGGYLAESGNGVLVLYRLSSPVCENLDAFKRWLAAWEDGVRKSLLAQFGEEIRCDSVHDNERIIKIPGTLSTKGDRENWRVARFVELPSVPIRSVIWSNVTAEKLIGTNGNGAHTQDTEGSRTLRRNAGPLTIERLDQKINIASACLARLKAERCDQYDSWIKVGLALSELGPIGLQLWDTWSRKSGKYGEGACAAKWDTFTKDPQITVGSLVYWADQDSPTGARPYTQHVARQPEADVESFDVFMQDAKPVEWLCKNIIGKGSIGFVAGLPKTMKTWILMDLAVEMARPTGNKWLNLFPVNRCKVLYIDQERPKGETQRRFKDIYQHKGLTSDDLKQNLTVQCGTTTKINLEPSFLAFKNKLDKLRPDVVIVDSFVTFHTLKENSRDDIQPVFEKLKTLRNEFGCAILFVDHETKNVFTDKENNEDPSAFRMAGSVGKSAAAELVLTVRRFDASSSTVYHTMSTLGPLVPSFTVSVKDVENGILVSGVS